MYRFLAIRTNPILITPWFKKNKHTASFLYIFLFAIFCIYHKCITYILHRYSIQHSLLVCIKGTYQAAKWSNKSKYSKLKNLKKYIQSWPLFCVLVPNTQNSGHMGTQKFKLNLWLKSILRVQLELLVKYYSQNIARTPI